MMITLARLGHESLLPTACGGSLSRRSQILQRYDSKALDSPQNLIVPDMDILRTTVKPVISALISALGKRAADLPFLSS